MRAANASPRRSSAARKRGTSTSDSPTPLSPPNERLHLAHRALDADEERARHDRVSDRELLDLADPRQPHHVAVVEPVAHADLEPQLGREPDRVLDPPHLVLVVGTVLGVAAGVDLDRTRADAVRGLDLLQVRRHEQARADAAVAERAHDLADLADAALHVQAALGGELLAP